MPERMTTWRSPSRWANSLRGCADFSVEVRVGSKVTVRIEGEDDEETWVIVGSAEAKPREGKISNESPLGAAMLGKHRNQKVTVNTPAGMMKLTILKIQ